MLLKGNLRTVEQLLADRTVDLHSAIMELLLPAAAKSFSRNHQAPLGVKSTIRSHRIRISTAQQIEVSSPYHKRLEDLHPAIQQVFGFDNDHLYAFFLNGTTNYKAGNVYGDPRGMGELPEYPADEFTLREIGLRLGKELWYLFDFGDNWMFLIQVVAIEDQTMSTKRAFELIESKGEAPEQYPDWKE
ncbi:MAG: hypothetical protein AAFO02_18745 [Bacteroidota bacterium]